jgi:NAD(P)H-flavin reductase
VLFVDEAKMSVPLDLDIEFAMGPPPMMRMTVRDMRQFGRQVGDIVKDFRAITPEFRI